MALKEKRIIRFDGDNYYLTIPDWDSYNQLFNQENQTKLPCYVYHTAPKPNGFWVYVHTGDDLTRPRLAKYLYEHGVLISREVEGPNTTKLFRPMLIPLDKSGKPCTEQFLKDNPDGSFLTGGTASINDNPLIPTSSNEIHQNDYIGILDTNHLVSLEWICYRGRLYCKQVFGSINIYDLEAQAPIFPELTEIQGYV